MNETKQRSSSVGLKQTQQQKLALLSEVKSEMELSSSSSSLTSSPSPSSQLDFDAASDPLDLSQNSSRAKNETSFLTRPVKDASSSPPNSNRSSNEDSFNSLINKITTQKNSAISSSGSSNNNNNTTNKLKNPTSKHQYSPLPTTSNLATLSKSKLIDENLFMKKNDKSQKGTLIPFFVATSKRFKNSKPIRVI